MDKIELQRCLKFLKNNGWESENENDCLWMHKENCFSICFEKEEMTFLDDSGDIYNSKINIYTLIGFLFHFRQIPCDYNSWK